MLDVRIRAGLRIVIAIAASAIATHPIFIAVYGRDFPASCQQLVTEC